MQFKSTNPFNNTLLETFQEYSKEQIAQIINKASRAFNPWRQVSFSERRKLMQNASQILLKNQDKYAQTITLEMGKPITESKAEIKKCAWVCEYYAENAEGFLQDQIIETDAYESFITHEPLGCILAIMPWNYPFWQVFRFAAPTLMAGNIGLLKHAPNVFRCALHIEAIFKEAGFPDGVFQNLIVHHDQIEKIIEHPTIKAVTLTGSEKAGASVAAIAGKNIKKTVLELGGSNAFVVWEDADMDQAVQMGIQARMQNAGQSCIAAKRFILVEKIYDEFVAKFLEGVKKLKTGNPMDEQTQIGTLARKDLADLLHWQVYKSQQLGASILLGGQQQAAFFEPTILTEVKPGMPVFEEEIFGPVAPLIKVKDKEESIELAENTGFGLGITLCTKDIAKAKKYIPKVSDGAFFINSLVKSDPRLPFGGTKYSGYGRELSKEGILEFVNKKTVYINKL